MNSHKMNKVAAAAAAAALGDDKLLAVPNKRHKSDEGCSSSSSNQAYYMKRAQHQKNLYLLYLNSTFTAVLEPPEPEVLAALQRTAAACTSSRYSSAPEKGS
ncbi:hypothetical protein TYRP_013851 [Tyrophagus putrescentiae]|nr:hypothetical protein TYRP_013851 [Tyrophagus putrescentiae]